MQDVEVCRLLLPVKPSLLQEIHNTNFNQVMEQIKTEFYDAEQSGMDDNNDDGKSVKKYDKYNCDYNYNYNQGGDHDQTQNNY